MIDGLRPDLQYQIALANLLSKNQPTETTTRLGDKVMQESFEPKQEQPQEQKPVENNQESAQSKPTENTNKTAESKSSENVEKTTEQKQEPIPQHTQQDYNPNVDREQTKNNDHTCSTKLIIVIVVVMFIMFLFMFYVSYQQRRMYKLFKKIIKEIS